MSCAAAMEVALRQRLEGVATVSISETNQTTEVTFSPGDHVFSPATFREAVRQADVQVVTMEIDACGVVEGQGPARTLRAGRNEFLLAGDVDVPQGTPVCVSGRLDDETDRMRLTVARVTPTPRGAP